MKLKLKKTQVLKQIWFNSTFRTASDYCTCQNRRKGRFVHFALKE